MTTLDKIVIWLPILGYLLAVVKVYHQNIYPFNYNINTAFWWGIYQLLSFIGLFLILIYS
jgi:hypothetical protein